MTIAKDMMVNDGIRARELRLIGQDGEQLGVKPKQKHYKSLNLHLDRNLFLLHLANKADFR